MEVVSRCKHKTWEEDMYWKHFNTMHFFQILPRDFHDHLALPTKFAENIMTELPVKASIIGPSGTLWEVDVMKTNNVLFVGDGWKEFVKAYDLQENNLLMFKYKRNLNFEVLMFDPQSLCEKETTYFVKKHEPLKSNIENDKKREFKEAFSVDVVVDEDEDETDVEDEDDGDSEYVVSKKARKSVEKTNAPTPRSVLSKGVRESRGRGRGRPRRRATPVKSPTNLKAQSGKKQDGNAGTKEQNTPEIGGSSVETDHCKDSNEASGRAKKQVPPRKLASGRGEKSNGNQASEEHDAPEFGASSLEMGHSNLPLKASGRPKKQGEQLKHQKGDETFKEQIIPDIGGSSLDTGHSEEPSEAKKKQVAPDEREQPNGDEADKEQNTPDNGGSTLETARSRKSPETRGRPKKRVASRTSRKLTFQDPNRKRYSMEYISNRRPVTESEKTNALESAVKEVTDKSFIAVMRPTSVYKRFYLSIPVEWMNKHLPRHNQDVILRVGEKTWKSGFYYNKKKGGGLSPGWKKFVVDNSLEEFDVCLFKLVSQKDDPALVMDVDIFRVIPEIIPPSPVFS